MPAIQVDVAAVTAPDQWDLFAGADKVVAVNLPDDDSTTCIRGPSSIIGDIIRYSLAASGIPAGSTINSVSVVTRAMSSGVNGGLIQGLALGVNESESAPIVTGGGSVWATTATALPRPGGGVWTLADLTTLEVYIEAIDASTWTYVTTIALIVDYSEGGWTDDPYCFFDTCQISLAGGGPEEMLKRHEMVDPNPKRQDPPLPDDRVEKKAEEPPDKLVVDG